MQRPLRQLTASQRSSILAALLAVVAVAALLGSGRWHPPIDADHEPLRDFVLVAMFAAAEMALLHIEFRREAYSFSLSGVPMAVGVLVCSPLVVVLTRLVGTSIAFLIQRPHRNKVIYNLASYAFEAAMLAAAMDMLVGGRHTLGTTVAGALTGLLVAADALMTTLLLKVITWHSGPMQRSERTRVYTSGAIIAVLASLLGLTFVILSGKGLVGILVLLGMGSVFGVIHRAYAALHRRHASLELVHHFVSGQQADDQSVDQIVGNLLGRICTSLRAGHASIFLDGWEGEPRLILVNEDGEVATWPAARLQIDDALYNRLPASREPVVLPRGTADPTLRAWLTARGLRDALLVPVFDNEGYIGSMLIADRQGETATFDADHLHVAQTLAAHMTVALRNAALMQRLRYDASHDALTGIANRALLRDALQNPALAATTADERPGRAALLLLDLDRFKEVNDVLGHVAGDRLLCVVAERLTALAPDGVVARLGGDEFAVLLTGLADDGSDDTSQGFAAAEEAAEEFAHRAIASLKQPVIVDDIALNAEASIGITVFTPGATSPGELLRQADLAMYAVKGTGRAVGSYSPDLERGQADRLALVADMRVGIDRDEFVMVYQPKLDLLTDRIIGVEALVRWQHPKLGQLGPDAFIQLAESAGLIDQLTDTVLRSSLTQCRTWREQGLDLGMAVNLSAHSLHDDRLPERVQALLDEIGLPASVLTLEVTEGSVVSEPERAIPILVRLAELGCQLSLDDFGTGFSSLSYLQNLPVQEIKIDRSFITGFLGDRRREALVAAIIGLAESLNLRVVAEGIEDGATLDQLRIMGCGAIQGYFLSRPAGPEQLTPLLTARGSAIAAGSTPAAPAGMVISPRERGLLTR